MFGGNCLQPIIWLGKTLKGRPAKDGAAGSGGGAVVYTAVPPAPAASGHGWVGYYVEVSFPCDDSSVNGRSSEYHMTTPGYVWPDTLPFADCAGEACRGHLL